MLLDRERQILRLLAILASTRQSKTVIKEGKVSKSTVLGQWFRKSFFARTATITKRMAPGTTSTSRAYAVAKFANSKAIFTIN